ncbi:nitroreductase family protein [Desulfomicrobium escambiense]|uniref:nitroreductase family protein n=1 Tax=Desulfomicrobium escambiense TaxID=29503 RepID=UPI0004037D4B|nr:nitroreductase family protein [Desulfomicrobium escambiense]
MNLLRNATLDTIHARHSIRQFSPEPLPEDMLTTILDAANQAPSAHNRQSWKFVVLEGDARTELAERVSAISKTFEKPASSLLRMAARSIASAPATIAVVNTGDLISHGTELFEVDRDQAFDFFRTMEIQSSAAAVENLLLAATSLGLGAVWLGILYLVKDRVLEFLQEPGGEFMAVVPVGKPLRPTQGPNKKPLENVVKKI